MQQIGNWLLQNLIGIDQQLNALAGGYADETLSSRAHRMRDKDQRYWRWTANFIDGMFFWQDGHCKRAWESELRRLQLPAHMRGDRTDETRIG